MNNSIYGLYIDSESDNNTVHHNSFIDNNLGGSSQAFDDGTNNTWFDESTLEGNYYSDYSGVGNYSIDGNANSSDTYPLTENPLILSYKVSLKYETLKAFMQSFHYCAKTSTVNNKFLFTFCAVFLIEVYVVNPILLRIGLVFY
jgi:hypothetical protein